MSAGSEKLPALTHTAHADCRKRNAVERRWRGGVRRRREGEVEGGGRGRGVREEGGGGGRRVREEGDGTRYARPKLRRETVSFTCQC